jgi:hypothetical protein
MNKAYITKYALTSGIMEEYTNDEFAHVEIVCLGKLGCYTVGNDIFDNKKDAYYKAELMRERKIKSLKKQLAKLESMSFKI